MRLPTILLTVSVLLAMASPVVADEPASYYLSLGDSLSTGYQPGLGDTDQGYADQLFPGLKAAVPSLELVKLGCRGETTTTMIKGGICPYDQGSQLGAAAMFLRDHPGQVRYLTIDIGGNDVNRCVKSGASTGYQVGYQCIVKAVGTVAANLWAIVSKVRATGGTAPVYAGMTYYDPVLAAWLTGKSGQALARTSVPLVGAVNDMERMLYSWADFRVADVSKAFASGDFRTQAGGLPLNVSRLCLWTYMCLRKDIHPNADGYQQIARTFAPLMTRT
jgi:lysophospholipase L1-like esterase